ncbi:hypothetical protein ACFQ4L_01350 [Lapidilactobacillus mulanensis]|uniref:DUF4064 domain-containing protein n=1 Tax=Lapidilactobacillus mulanensis TaxID=2485999 RepID=A0ABW4DLG3_9LACO|nr:hypothetical protein [Lapidilactobacillus mulanensis]
MNKSVRTSVLSLNIVQLLIYLVGFYNFAAGITHHQRLFNTDITSLPGICYWSLLSMISVVGLVLSIYLLVKQRQVRSVGLIISTIAFASPIIFMFFLIIPATLSLLAIIFLRIDNAENSFEAANSGKGATHETD